MKLLGYTALFLQDEQDRVLVLKRAAWKKFAPNLYTGIGGQLLITEYDNIEEGLRRELEEETGLKLSEVQELELRGSILVVNRGDGSIDSVVYYYLGRVRFEDVIDLSCNEGELEWYAIDALEGLDFIPTIKKCYRYVFDKTVKKFTSIYDESDGSHTLKLTVK